MTTLHPDQPLTVNTIDLDYLADLYTAANFELQSGHSVIPVWGDSAADDFAKVPPIKWAKYKDQLPRFSDTREWFSNRGYAGLAMICGQVSGNMFVIETDTAEWNARFEADFPELLNTHTTLSGGRKLPHRRYTAPSNISVTFRGQKGAVELRGEGHYVVISPTCINGNSYEVIRGGAALQLTPEQMFRVTTWFDENFGAPSDDNSEYESIPIGNAARLIASFNRQVIKRNSRNQAAFVTLGWARDNGWSKGDARDALRAAFVNSAPANTHHQETPGARGKEFDATVRSVYSHAPRKRLASGLPTLLREHLLQRGLIGLSRLLDCLMMCGWEAGKRFTETEAVAQCGQHGISRPTVHAALNVKLCECFGAVSTPSTSLALVEQVSFSDGLDHKDLDVMGVPSNRMALVFNAKDTRNFDYIQIRGHQVLLSHMPDVLELCAALQIKMLFSDQLPFAALATIGDYRGAITRSLIERQPSQYAQRMLAKRVGVSDRAMRKALKRDKRIKTTPCYQEQYVTAENLESVISDERTDMGGFYLDVRGKRFPPIRSIAQDALKFGYPVKLIKREANHYAVQPEVANAPSADFATEIGVELGVIVSEVHVPVGTKSSAMSPNFIDAEYIEYSAKSPKRALQAKTMVSV